MIYHTKFACKQTNHCIMDVRILSTRQQTLKLKWTVCREEKIYKIMKPDWHGISESDNILHFFAGQHTIWPSVGPESRRPKIIVVVTIYTICLLGYLSFCMCNNLRNYNNCSRYRMIAARIH